MVQFLVPRQWQKPQVKEEYNCLTSIFDGKCVYLIDFVQVPVDQKQLYLKYFVAFTLSGQIWSTWTGFPGLVQEQKLLRASGILEQLSNGDILICKSSNSMIEVYEFDKSTDDLKFSSTILDYETLVGIRKIINTFTSRFAVVRNLSVNRSLSAPNSQRSSPLVDLFVQVSCALHNSNPLKIVT